MTVELITEPRVSMIAATYTHYTEMAGVLGCKPDAALHSRDAYNIELLPIFAGRACYQSFGEKAGRRSAEEYLGHILDSGHLSVLEHSSVSFYIEGVSRSLTHELVRHRHFSFSQLSQRYVSVEDHLAVVVPPAVMQDGVPLAPAAWEEMAMVWQEQYRMFIAGMEARGITGKQAREAARSTLPNCVETKIVVTGNLRAWLEFLSKRDSPHADAEMQRLAKVIRAHLQDIAPHVFRPTGG